MTLKLVGRVPREALAKGQMVRLTYPPFDVLVTEHEGKVSAIEDACNHAGASLSGGARLEGGRISCPMHGYIFDLGSGELLSPKGLCGPQRTYVTTLEGSDVLVWDRQEFVVF